MLPVCGCWRYGNWTRYTWVDVDQTAAYMAYIQLTLLHIPATVVVGNSLTLEVRETYYTPAHILGFWGSKLKRGRVEQDAASLMIEPKPYAMEPLTAMPDIVISPQNEQSNYTILYTSSLRFSISLIRLSEYETLR